MADSPARPHENCHCRQYRARETVRCQKRFAVVLRLHEWIEPRIKAKATINRNDMPDGKSSAGAAAGTAGFNQERGIKSMSRQLVLPFDGFTFLFDFPSRDS